MVTIILDARRLLGFADIPSNAQESTSQVSKLAGAKVGLKQTIAKMTGAKVGQKHNFAKVAGAKVGMKPTT